MITFNSVFKFSLAALVVSGLSFALWSVNEPSVAVNKSPVPAHKCCSTWEDHMRASGIDVEVGRTFDVKALLTGGTERYMPDAKRAVMHH